MIYVVVPVYNTEALLPRCIDSICQQTLTQWRLILVDDASTDGSLEVCRRYAHADDRITVLSKPNGGAASARNFALDHISDTEASVVFVDSDDAIHPLYLTTLDVASKGVDCVVCGMIDVYDTHATTHSPDHAFVTSRPYGDADFMALFRTGLLNSPCNKLYRLDIIRKANLRFDTAVYNEDISFNVEYFSHCHSVRVITESLYYYFHRSGSVTGAVPERAFADYIDLHTRLLDHVDEPLRPLVHDFVSYQYAAIALRFMRRREFDVARRHISNAMVQKALSEHSPYSRIDAVQMWLLRHRMLRLYHALFLR